MTHDPPPGEAPPTSSWGLQPVTTQTVARALPPALLWAYVSAVAAALAVGVVALLATIISGAVWVFSRETEIGESVSGSVGVALWIVGPLALGAAVGAAAYASTKQRSFPRSLVGTVAALAMGAGLLSLDASGFAAGALAFGWAVAIPADKPSRIALRGLPLLALAAILTTATWGRVGDLAVWQLGLVLALSPLVAALWVWLADWGWSVGSASRMRRRNRNPGNPPPGTVVN